MYLETAIAYAAAGIPIIPVRSDGSKAPYTSQGKDDATTDTEQTQRWWQRWPDAWIGVVGIEGIDIDNKATPDADTLYREWADLVENIVPGLVQRLLCETTPSGGYHLVWHCSTIQGNQKLATRPPTAAELEDNPRARAVTLIETRGKGGYFAVAPSPGYTLLRGDWCNLPEISPEERELLLAAARAQTLQPQPPEPVYANGNGATAGERPGDDFNERGKADVLTLLQQAGWRVVRQKGEKAYLCRPGKQMGVSATWNHGGSGVLYVFSTNASPFDADTSYSPFAVYAHLEHSGDFKRAASTLRSQGYGKQGERSSYTNGRSAPKNRTDTELDRTGALESETETELKPNYERTRLIHADALDQLPDITWLVDGWLPQGVITQVFGEPGQGKSHVLLDLALTVAQQHNVIYIAAEDELQYKTRKQAWCSFRKLGAGGLYFWTAPINLFDQQSVADFIALVRVLQPALLVFDPLAQCAVGHDLDKGADMNVAVDALGHIRHQLNNPALILCHHTGWNTDHERGSSVLRGACRAVYKLANHDGLIEVECKKMNNAPAPESRYFRLVEHESSVVLLPAQKVDMRDAPLSKRQIQVLEALTLKTLKDASFSQIVDHTEMSKSTMNGSLSRLIERGYVMESASGRTRVYNITWQGEQVLERNGKDTEQFGEQTELGSLNWHVEFCSSSVFRTEANTATESQNPESSSVEFCSSSVSVRSRSVSSFAPPPLGGANYRTPNEPDLEQEENAGLKIPRFRKE